VITKSAILISAQFNISPHYSFMVQNQINVSPCLTIAICLPRVLHNSSLLWGSTVGYPSDSLASCWTKLPRIQANACKYCKYSKMGNSGSLYILL